MNRKIILSAGILSMLLIVTTYQNCSPNKLVSSSGKNTSLNNVVVPAPIASQSCISAGTCQVPHWSTSNYGACSKACGTGQRTRQVDCLIDMVIVHDNECRSLGAKPATSEACNQDVCPTASPTASLCPGGRREGRSFKFSDDYFGFGTVQQPELFETLGNKEIVVFKLEVPAGYSTARTNVSMPFPMMAFTNSPIPPYSDRTTSISTQPCDFSSVNSQIVGHGAFGYSFSFKTNDDLRSGAEATLMSPGTYYINIRNDNCPVGRGPCAFDGQFRNWLR